MKRGNELLSPIAREDLSVVGASVPDHITDHGVAYAYAFGVMVAALRFTTTEMVRALATVRGVDLAAIEAEHGIDGSTLTGSMALMEILNKEPSAT